MNDNTWLKNTNLCDSGDDHYRNPNSNNRDYIIWYKINQVTISHEFSGTIIQLGPQVKHQSFLKGFVKILPTKQYQGHNK